MKILNVLTQLAFSIIEKEENLNDLTFLNHYFKVLLEISSK